VRFLQSNPYRKRRRDHLHRPSHHTGGRDYNNHCFFDSEPFRECKRDRDDQLEAGSVGLNKLAPYSSIPAMEADIRFAMVPASMALIPKRASSPFLLGARAPIPPI